VRCMRTIYSILGIIAALVLVTAIANNLVSEVFAAKGGIPGPNDNQGQCQKEDPQTLHDACHELFHPDDDDDDDDDDGLPV
jgi:hypothetical protein